jgi:regulator of sirC expression with transglutaminase-like and TPR domain
MQAGMGFGVNPANGNLEHHYGFFPVVVNYSVEFPDTFVLRIFVDDTERLVYFINEIFVSESDFAEYEIGDIFGQSQEAKEDDFE